MCLRLRVLVMVSALWGALPCLAQAVRRGAVAPAIPMPTAEAKDPYAGEAVVIEQHDSTYRYRADGTGTKLDTTVALLKTQAAVRSFSVLSFPYPAGSQHLEIDYVRVRRGNGTIVETPATDAQDQPAPLTLAAPLYSDLHLLGIPVRGLRVGDRLEYRVRSVFTQPGAKDQFWGTEDFGRSLVVLERTIELRVPVGTFVRVSSPKFPAGVSEEDGDRVYRWKGSQPGPTTKPATRGEAADANPQNAEDAESTPAIAWTTFHSWAEVGDWYRGLALDRSAPTPELKAKANELAYGFTTPEARTRALYAFVSSQVRSINTPLGAGRYQPHPAAEVLANQYGDSKDKQTLLAALLRAQNLSVATVLIGTGIDLDPAIPAPGWFDDEITLVNPDAREPLWLDTMAEVAPFGMLSASLRDKLALVIPPTGEATLRRTPAEPPFAAYTHFEATGTLSAEGDLNAHVTITMRGDDELGYREDLRAATPAQWDRLAQYMARSAGLPGDLSNTVADLPEATDTPLHVGYDYTKKPFGDWENFRIAPLQPLLKLPMSDRKAAPERDIAFGGKRTETAVSKITLPPGFSADLPAGLHVHADFATLDATYRLERVGDSQVLVTERTLVIKEDKLPAAQWPAYRKFLDEQGDAEPWVQLTSMSVGGTAERHPPAAGESNPAAAELVRKAGELTEAKDWDEAAKKLDAAKALNPRQALLWSEYGYIAAKSGRLGEASDDYRREVKQHPEESAVSRSLAGVQVSQGDTQDAVQTLKASLALDRKDEATWILLSRIQSQGDGRGGEATLRDGLQELPDSLGIKLALGDTLLKGGKAEEGGRLLASVATESQDPSQLNDAAYLLGDTSLNLPVAEAASRRSIHAMNAAGARGENGIGGVAALRRSMLLVASWDTYGWILLRKGSPSEAEPWLRAAWADGFGAVPGQHLAKLLARQGHTAEAAHILRLATGAGTGAVPGAASDPVQRLAVALTARPGGVVAGSMDTRATLQKERTFNLPNENTTGSAVFEMDYALRAAPVARFVRGEQGLAAMSLALSKLDTHTLIPPGSAAHLLRRGVLNCGGSVCTLLIMLPAEAAADAGG